MPTKVSKRSIKRARQLRRVMTDGEKKLWSELKSFRGWHGLHARKQAPIGIYIVDFVIQERRLIIEVDGEHHFTAEGMARDAKRDAWLESVGYRVLRFDTGDLSSSFEGCVEEILDALGLMGEDFVPPPLTPPLKGEGGVTASECPSEVRGGGKPSRDKPAEGRP